MNKSTTTSWYVHGVYILSRTWKQHTIQSILPNRIYGIYSIPLLCTERYMIVSKKLENYTCIDTTNKIGECIQVYVHIVCM